MVPSPLPTHCNTCDTIWSDHVGILQYVMGVISPADVSKAEEIEFDKTAKVLLFNEQNSK